ncbi:S41 family peptidase, partial [Coprobacter fastidiosus]
MKRFIYAIALFLIFSVCAKAQRQTDASKKLSLAAYVISTLYVDDVNEDKLTEDAIRAMLEQLDPHSTYLDPQEVKDMSASLDGNFDGVGIQFTMTNDTLYVIQTVAGGPSEKVGILAGDRIVEINDTVVAGVKMSTKDIMTRLRGKRGTKVDVTVLRKDVPDPIPFRITRDKIPVYSIDASYMVDKHTGYIRLSRFSATSVQEFVEAMLKLRRAG